MTDAPDNLILEQLRLIRGDLADLKIGQDRLDTRMSALEVRMSGLETQMAAFSTVADSDRDENCSHKATDDEVVSSNLTIATIKSIG